MLAGLFEKVNPSYKTGVSRVLCQIFWFCLGGLFNTAIFYGVFGLMYVVDAHYYLCYAAGFILSTLFAYYWNSRLSFHKDGVNADRGEEIRHIIKMLLLYASTLLLSWLLLRLLVDGVGVNDMIAPLISLFCVMPINFLLNKFWVFR